MLRMLTPARLSRRRRPRQATPRRRVGEHVEPAVVEEAVEAPDVDVTVAPEASPSGEAEAEAEAAAPETETAEATPEDKAEETPTSEGSESADE